MSVPLKVLVLMNRIPYPLKDGGAIGSFNFVKGYAKAGCMVHVLAMNTSRHYVERKHLSDNLLKYATLDDVYVDNRITVTGAARNLFKDVSYITERFISNSFSQKLEQVLRAEHFDVVHVDGLPCAWYTDIIRKNSKALISYRAHNVEHYIWERIAEKDSNPLKKWYLKIQSSRLKKYEAEALAKMDVVMTISKEDDDMVHHFSPKAKTRLVPAGFDVEDELPKGNSAVNPLFFIGALDWMPNIQGVDWFFETIWPSLSKAYPELVFKIAGKKMPYRILGLKSQNVIPVGEVEEAKEFIRDGGVMIVPIISGSGIRIKILEAMALGKCVVATTIAAEGLGLIDGVHILIADNAGQFIEKIGRCINEPDFRQSIARNAHTFALENFQNKKIFARLVVYYRTLL